MRYNGGFYTDHCSNKILAPKTEETPARCKKKIVRSRDAPARARLPARGTHTVHTVPALVSTIDDVSNSRKDKGRSQKLLLFIRGNAMSGALVINDTSQFPKPQS